MKKKVFSLLALLLMAATGAWATDGIAVTKSDVGKVICTDGSIVATVSDATAASKTAAAMIAYVDETNKTGLGIALEDVSSDFYTWDNSGSNNGGKTAAELCSAWNTSKAVTGGTWQLPSAKDWQYMFIGCGSGESYSDPTDLMEKSYSELDSKLGTAGGTALEIDLYWSSMEYDAGVYAWTLSFGGNYNGFKASFHKTNCFCSLVWERGRPRPHW